MKKINLILGACVIAAATLLASCNNGPQDLTNVRSTTYRYAYTVSGTLTIENKSGVTTAVNVTTNTATIKTALADVTWYEDELSKKTSTTTPAGGTAVTTKKSDKFGVLSYEQLKFEAPVEGYYDYSAIKKATSLSDVYNAYLGKSWNSKMSNYSYYNKGSTIWGDYGYVIKDISVEIYKMGGDYYINPFGDEYVKLADDAFDGFFGDDEFTLKYSTVGSSRMNLTQAAKDDTTVVSSTTTTYDLKFTKVSAE